MDSKQGFSAPRAEEEKECKITRPGGGTISLRGNSVECCKMSACAGNDITADEQDLINRLHKLLGDRWPLIAGRLPWRRVEEIENYCKMRTQEGHRLSTSATRS